MARAIEPKLPNLEEFSESERARTRQACSSAIFNRTRHTTSFYTGDNIATGWTKHLERKHVYDVVKKTILQGESHSVLILGPRGCGKTTLVNSVLHDLAKEVDMANDAIIIRLNGLLLQDDKVALKSITAQMQLENAVGDRVFGTFAENLAFLVSCLQSGADRSCKSMVFILDEFDTFCHSERTQTLLYNLFEITQSQQAPACVLGITGCLDVMELVEKRVKSRFSHRHIFLFPNKSESEDDGNAISPLETCKNTVVKLLSVPTMNVSRKIGTTPRKRKSKSRQSIANTEENGNIQYSIPEEILIKCSTDFSKFNSSFLEDWNEHIVSLIENQEVIDGLEQFCYYKNNEQILRNILLEIICKLSPTKPYLEPEDFISAIEKIVNPTHKVKQLQSMSILELSLVIAMKHGMEIFDRQPMNFEMVLHRYTKFANANSPTQTCTRSVILKAFEHLQALELIMPVRATDSIYSANDTTVSRVQKEYQLYTLACRIEDLEEAIKNLKPLPTEIKHWFNNSVV